MGKRLHGMPVRLEDHYLEKRHLAAKSFSGIGGEIILAKTL